MNASPALASAAISGDSRMFSNLKRAYRCRCGRLVFFRNTQCLNCQAALGYEPLEGKVSALDPGPAPDVWRLVSTCGSHAALYRRCANLNSPAGCNWLVKVEQGVDDRQTLCISCRLN